MSKGVYLAHRKGWSFSSADTLQNKRFERMISEGCRLIIWDRHRATPSLNLPHFKKAKDDQDFTVYEPQESEDL